jgi:anti-anti-sigma factor
MKPAKVTKTKIGAYAVLTPRDALSHQNCEELAELFSSQMNQSKSGIILDCKAVSFMDSAALELLLQVHGNLKSRGSVLKLCNLNAVCRDILLATRLVAILHIYQDVHDAIKK